MASSGFDGRLDERFDPVFQRGHEDDAIAFAPHPSPAREAEVPIAAAAGLRGNPWVVVLWSVAVLFSAGGLGMTWYSQQLAVAPDVGTPVSYYVLPAVLGAVAPIVLGVGLATLAGVLFLHAVRWRR
ncbi:hypothetical protein [Schumannella luteola]